MSIGALFWFGNIRGLSLLLHYISLTFPNQTIIKCLQSKRVRKWIIHGLILCDDVVSQYVQSRSERVYSKITWLSLGFQDRVLAYVLPFILTFLIAVLKGSREISLSDFLLSYISRKTGRKTEPSQYSRVFSCHFRKGNKSFGPEICARNEDRIFPAEGGLPKKKKKVAAKKETLQEMVEAMIKGKEQQQNESPKDTKKASTKEIVLEAELDQVKKELADVQARENYWKKSYTISRLNLQRL